MYIYRQEKNDEGQISMLNLNGNIKLIATDLDGTLLKTDRTISEKDWQTLHRLESSNIVRVAATGRSLFKVRQVLTLNAPFDYLVFSSGAGIYDWSKQQLLQSEHFEPPIIEQLCRYLVFAKLNFFVFKPIPNNNLFWHHHGGSSCQEFDNYLDRHTGDYTVLDEHKFPNEAGQFLAIIPNNDKLFEELKNGIYQACSGVKVIRATSPVDPLYTWLEIFPETVSKGHGIKWLCDKLNIGQAATIGIGNDYNDADMFDYVAHPYLLKNGVEALKQKYRWVGFTNDENGFSAVVEQMGG
jgi:Cof subfamily protein (haloacid dehalogenase superfamily)